MEIEEQRVGRNKDTQVNKSYISSGEYRRKFDEITDDTDFARLLYQLAKEMLIHRAGTLYEDMYWIDMDTLEIVASETGDYLHQSIHYSPSTVKAITSHSNLLTIHTHPASFPPSINDFNANYIHGYTLGIIICHDGKIFSYYSREMLDEQYCNYLIATFIKSGYNDYEAQMAALNKLSDNFKIKFKEVAGNDLRK